MRKTLAELGIHNYFYYDRGKYNNITDVKNVRVGHSTIIKGENVRTGVTAVMFQSDYANGSRFAAGGHVINANGEITGFQYIMEEGKLISPVLMTTTLSVGDVHSSIIRYFRGKIALPVVGECLDDYLNDVEGRHVKYEHVVEAIESAKSGKIEQGSVGAGTGMTTFGFKGGIGSSSRKVSLAGKEFTIGVLVNNNMGIDSGTHKYLRIGGLDIGRIIDDRNNFVSNDYRLNAKNYPQSNSSICIIATDIPLEHRQLNRIAKRSVMGIGRLGYVSYAGSGDFVLAVSTNEQHQSRNEKVFENRTIPTETMLDDVFEATIEAVEEAYLNSLLTAEDMTGLHGHTIKAIPIEDLMNKYHFN